MEQVLSEYGGARVLVKSGPAKPMLEILAKSQCSLANLTIFNKLVSWTSREYWTTCHTQPTCIG